MVEIEEAVLVAAAKGLTHAGLWDLGAGLLAAAGSSDDPRIPLARADLELQRDFFLRTHSSGPSLTAAAEAVEAVEAVERSDDPTLRWELGLLQLRSDYGGNLFAEDGEIRDPASHDAELKAGFAKRAAEVHGSAPSAARAGWAAFWAGVITDNIVGDPTAADVYYREALDTGESEGDDLLVSYALRHLGAHAEPDTARAYHERSLRLRRTAGFVPGVLAEQIELAELDLKGGQRERGVFRAEEVRDWAAAIGIDLLANYAGRLVDEA